MEKNVDVNKERPPPPQLPVKYHRCLATLIGLIGTPIWHTQAEECKILQHNFALFSPA